MNEPHVEKIAGELKLKSAQVRSTAELIGEGCTVPFIARYRKEATGSLDEVAITDIRDRLEQLAELDQRRNAILKSLEERELLTEELSADVNAAESMSVLEDIYLPYRPKRRTRATMAKEKGLEPLAQHVFEQVSSTPLEEAAAFVDPEKGVDSVEDALQGARDIIAEWANENAEARAGVRELFLKRGRITSKVAKGKDEEGAKFRDYFDWEELLAESPGHRVHAMLRGENEKVLSVQVRPPQEDAQRLLNSLFVKAENASADQVVEALEDGYKRLLAPSLETEIRAQAKGYADEEAIKVFTENLSELLLAAPLGQKRVIALDPGFRTGAKLVCLDGQGKLLYNTTIYPTHSGEQAKRAGETLKDLVDRYGAEAIAIGNGTASRETESFVRSLDLPTSISIVLVNESGASIYSASKTARDEFPDHDVTVRGSVSIGRRLMDPLAELVKIDAKSIGVGQYQHDVDQTALKRSLDDVVMRCVNRVGVEVNTASKQLLSYVSGLGPTLAENVIKHREANGPFGSRKEILKVRRLGPKAFEQAAGFLRISDADNPLDSSAVHPESYPIVELMARDLDCSISDLISDPKLREGVKIKDYVTETAGLPTLKDIISELAKPGRDPRDKFEVFSFADGVNELEDLKPGMKLPGIVTNVTRFGAFVDVGVHQDGLVHISQLADRFVEDPSDVVKVSQKVTVTVLEVDMNRRRISLSMKENPEPQGSRGGGGSREPKQRSKAPFNPIFIK